LLLVAVAALVVVLAFGIVRLRGASWVVPYALLVPLVVLAARTSATAVQVAQAAIVLPVAALLWTLGREYRVWAAFATAVLALSLLSESVQSFGRQALFAFPLLWVPANGPAWLRARPVALLALAANVALCLTVTRWAP
jgi:predicted lysophospholipase L1 biosynthesis ABC-type transport system permease subunit